MAPASEVVDYKYTVVFEESITMEAVADVYKQMTARFGEKGLTEKEDLNSTEQCTTWRIGLFQIRILMDQKSTEVALLSTLVIPLTDSGVFDKNAVGGPLKDDGDELVQNFIVNTNKGAQLLKAKVRVYVTEKENELQIWGHVDSQSDVLGNIDVDLSFGKVSGQSSDGPCQCTEQNPCGCKMDRQAVSCKCTKASNCGCAMTCKCIKGKSCGCKNGYAFTCTCITAGTGVHKAPITSSPEDRY
ncbi:hypothetical protein M422DRAFT_783186 [Sphaerobolus stellatus SS14]|uniref:Uncharacterized protein n=1 Tax=Sphaerobolus stellatus (strain SS14) TaxID=990650 RepID=A0A0C9UEZ5_SPHS4|nr:hypothetical protein M422DRAFT_783186 [Sphaerobolus stellatus SS14]